MADKDKIQTAGRKGNPARPQNVSDNKRGPERYPPVRQDDAVESAGTGERRSFDPSKDAPSQPPQGAGDTSPSTASDRLGPRGDPAEGKR
jgi:hypothetical protein